ncbi:MAG TPA: sigma-70 family RNA polymerase sigma factor [Pseudomonadales bacterium]|nr:sigma-70 family RNA polymerase sigma factor [Pseudomonadales bacterium]
MTEDDMTLVRQYVAHQSESAFAALVSRHTNLVYSTTFRRVGSSQLAEEITQAVFIILARKCSSFDDQTILPGWLYRVTCYASGHALKQELRRRHREQEAYMQSHSDPTEPEVWPQITPLLEDAMVRLNQADRDALILRFFEGLSLKEVSTVLGASEAAAKMRVGRALEKLRVYFSRHGVNSTVETIAGAMSAGSVIVAPAALAKTAAAVALAKSATASASTSTLMKGALKLMAWTKMKTALVVGAVAVLSITTTTLVIQLRPRTEFPRSSWKFAGYADPKSAFMSYLWASVCQTNRDTFEQTLTPGQRNIYTQMIAMNMKVPQPHSEEATVAETFQRASDQWQNGSYRIIRGPVISEGQAVIQVEAHVADRTMDVQVKLKRMGNEWRFDGIQHRKIMTNNAQM